MEPLLIFRQKIGSQKPFTMRGGQTPCPFCDERNLEKILAREGPYILVENKYPTLQDTYQSVLIETPDCQHHIATYSRAYNRALFRFAFAQLERFEQDPSYQSVLFFKNHGPDSGGSLSHAHMQIVGCKTVDYHALVPPETFLGFAVKGFPVEVTLSSHPIMQFSEYGIRLSTGQEDDFSDTLQDLIIYLTQHWRPGSSPSYNLFFYQTPQGRFCKLMPRYVTSPIFAGYRIVQRHDEAYLKDLALQIQRWKEERS